MLSRSRTIPRREFIIKIDHKPLKYLLKQRMYTEAQNTWLLKLHNYKFVVEYKKGKENVVADSLSRKADNDEAFPLIITVVESDWLRQLRSMVDSDMFFQNLNNEWEGGSTLDLGKYQKRGYYFIIRT